jgi:hypothetical protein
MSDENKVVFVTVKAAKEDNRVVLWETHPDHITKDNPTGEIFITGDGKTHTVARTPEVEKRLRDRTLVETNETPEKPATTQREATPKPAPVVHVENIGRSKG